MHSTKLSTLINRMDRYQAIVQNANQSTKVRDIDEQIRNIRRILPLPWCLRKSTLRVFDGVYSYPVATDHDELAYLDVENQTPYQAKARFRYTSLQQFWEDSSNRNSIAEIWDGGNRKLGVNYKDNAGSATTLNSALSVTGWSASGDAGTPVIDTTLIKDSISSIKVPVTMSSGTATIKNTVTVNDSAYKSKYHFKWIYLPYAPTSIELKLQTDDSNYVSTVLTSQFDGSSFKENDWNLIAQDLSKATETGTFNPASIGSEVTVLVGAATGDYYIETSYLRGWKLLDYWYYSMYLIKVSGAAVASKEYFYDDDAVGDAYVLTDELVGDSEWADVIMYGAMLNQAIDIKDKDLQGLIAGKLNAAVEMLGMKYPSLDPVQITDRYNFIDDFISPSK